MESFPAVTRVVPRRSLIMEWDVATVFRLARAGGSASSVSRCQRLPQGWHRLARAVTQKPRPRERAHGRSVYKHRPGIPRRASRRASGRLLRNHPQSEEHLSSRLPAQTDWLHGGRPGSSLFCFCWDEMENIFHIVHHSLLQAFKGPNFKTKRGHWHLNFVFGPNLYKPFLMHSTSNCRNDFKNMFKNFQDGILSFFGQMSAFTI